MSSAVWVGTAAVAAAVGAALALPRLRRARHEVAASELRAGGVSAGEGRESETVPELARVR